MASSDRLTVRVKGRGAHAAYPWRGVDPIAVAAQIVLALEALPARQVDARVGSVVSFGAIHGGVRYNIIPDEVELAGTIRALAPDVREQLHERIRRTARASPRARARPPRCEIDQGNPITWNDPELARRIRPTLERVAGRERVIRAAAVDRRRGLLALSGARAGGVLLSRVRTRPVSTLADAAPNHSPRFVLDEGALEIGVRALAQVAVDTLGAPPR